MLYGRSPDQRAELAKRGSELAHEVNATNNDRQVTTAVVFASGMREMDGWRESGRAHGPHGRDHWHA